MTGVQTCALPISKGAYHAFLFLMAVALIYLGLTTLSHLVFYALEKRFSRGFQALT